MADLTHPLISVIIPCYNQGCFLSESLESVLAQSYTTWECIIINDGSTDETEEVVDTYLKKDNRFKYIKTQNSGLSSSRNTGIKNSKGDFIQLLDSDDLLEVYKLENAIEFYLSNDNNQKVIVYSSMRYFENGNVTDLKIVGRDNFVAHIEIKKEDSSSSQKELLITRNPFVISAPLYPRSLFDTIGYFDNNLKALEDWDFHLRCVHSNYKFHHSYKPDSFTLIRLHNNSMMRNQQLLDENFYKLILKHNLQKIETIAKEPLSKKVIKEISPPIFLRLLKKLIKLSKKIDTYYKSTITKCLI